MFGLLFYKGTIPCTHFKVFTFFVDVSDAFFFISALIFSKSFCAGSSVGFCFTSLPSNAFLRMLKRNALACSKLVSMISSILSQMERRDSIS